MAGLIAKKALELGIKIPWWVKTSFAPGSRVVEKYLEDANLINPLNSLGFDIVGYGCTTCIGNSGPLSKKVSELIESGDHASLMKLNSRYKMMYENQISVL